MRKKLSVLTSLVMTCFLLLSFNERCRGTDTPMSLADVTTWAYQLQDIDLQAIGNTAFGLIIIDYSSDGTEEGEFKAGQIDALKHSSGGDKIVCAYMSIGEAEDYRFYWQDGWCPGNPGWLDSENPDWEGNYKVQYWESGWQDIIFDYTDRLLNAHFDGVYLDIIDAYEVYTEKGYTRAAQDMADFVAAIATHARSYDPDFAILSQNAPELATLIPSYLNSVDGIGQEDIYYGYDGDGVATPQEVTNELETYLNVFKNDGKLVLTVDYPFSNENEPNFDEPTLAKINDAYSRSLANGYVPYCTVRNLNYLTINIGHEPTGIPGNNLAHEAVGFELFQNHLNPFNAMTIIRYALPHRDFVELVIFNLSGRCIRTLFKKNQPAGMHDVLWDARDNFGRDVASGVYCYRLKTKNFIQTKKCLILR